jgi:lactate dehydrogenase-like 2-hydroxyacid dehydrogenase
VWSATLGAHRFDAFLSGVEFLVNVLPVTPATKGLLDARAFALLAPGAHVVNIGRGVTLVDADLLAALDSGQVSGATLDVFGEEPLPPATPVLASSTRRGPRRTCQGSHGAGGGGSRRSPRKSLGSSAGEGRHRHRRDMQRGY